MTTSENPPEIAVPRSRRPWLLFALGVLLAGAGLWLGWRWYSTPRIIEIGLEGVDPEVVVLVRKAEDSVRQSPRSASAWGQLGMTLLANKFEAESIASLAQAEVLDPDDARWPYLRGVALAGRSPEEALPCFRRAVVLCRYGDAEAAHLRLAEILAANGHYEEARDEFLAVPHGPLTPCVDYGLGTLAAARGDLASAKTYLTKCANNPLTRKKASARLLAVSRLLGEAKEDDASAAELPADPPWPDPFLHECLTLVGGKSRRMHEVAVLESQGQAARALEMLRGVARDYPDAPTLLALGITLGRRGLFQESETNLRKCLELEPQLVRAQYYLSLALFAQGEALSRQAGFVARFEEAAKWARRATELDPSHGEAHFQLGLILLSLDRRAEAIAAFRRAVATRPELPATHLWLGKTLADDGKREEALKHLRDAVRYAAPNDPGPRMALDQLLKKAP